MNRSNNTSSLLWAGLLVLVAGALLAASALARAQGITVWQKGYPPTPALVSSSGKSYTATRQPNGKWVTPVLPAGTYELRLVASKDDWEALQAHKVTELVINTVSFGIANRSRDAATGQEYIVMTTGLTSTTPGVYTIDDANTPLQGVSTTR